MFFSARISLVIALALALALGIVVGYLIDTIRERRGRSKNAEASS